MSLTATCIPFFKKACVSFREQRVEFVPFLLHCYIYKKNLAIWGITAAFHYPINSENTNGTDFERKMKGANPQRKEIFNIQHAASR